MKRDKLNFLVERRQWQQTLKTIFKLRNVVQVLMKFVPKYNTIYYQDLLKKLWHLIIFTLAILADPDDSEFNFKALCQKFLLCKMNTSEKAEKNL